MRRLLCGMDHELERSSRLSEYAVDRVGIADVDLERAKGIAHCSDETLGRRCRRRVRTEKQCAHVVLEADHVVALLLDGQHIRKGGDPLL